MPVKTYSSGMSLRLQFSIATALKPDILLMDEWISSADNEFKKKMDSKLEEMIEETPIVIIASHSKDRLYNWASKVINLKSGKITKVENLAFPSFFLCLDQPTVIKTIAIIIVKGCSITTKRLAAFFITSPLIWLDQPPEKYTTKPINNWM